MEGKSEIGYFLVPLSAESHREYYVLFGIPIDQTQSSVYRYSEVSLIFKIHFSFSISSISYKQPKNNEAIVLQIWTIDPSSMALLNYPFRLVI